MHNGPKGFSSLCLSAILPNKNSCYLPYLYYTDIHKFTVEKIHNQQHLAYEWPYI